MKTQMIKSASLCLLLFLSILRTGHTAPVTWNDFTPIYGGDWGTPASWLPVGVPAPGDDAIFPGTPTGGDRFIRVSTPQSINSVTFSGPATDNSYFGYATGGSLSIAALMDVTGSAYYRLYFPINFTGPTLTLQGSGSGHVELSGPLNGTPALIMTGGDYSLKNPGDLLNNFNPSSFTISGGNLTLQSNSTVFGGPVDINGGTLCLQGPGYSAPAWNVNSGGTLKTDGTIIGPVNVSGGAYLTAGCSPGTASLTSLTLKSGAHAVFDLAQPGVVGGGSDLINVSGGLTLNGVLDIVPQSGFGTGTYRLFNYGGTLLVNNAFAIGSGLPAGFGAKLDYATPGQVNLIVLVDARPKLTSTRASSTLHLTWTDASYRLEKSIAIGSAASWSPAAATSPVDVIIVPGNLFFRLVKP